MRSSGMPGWALLAAGLTAAGWGCTSVPRVAPNADIRVVEVADVRKMLDSGQPIEALGALETLARGGGDTGELAELGDRARELARADLARALADGRFERALSLAASLNAVGEPAAPAGSQEQRGEQAILVTAARRSAEDGKLVLAAHYGFRLASLVGVGNTEAADRAAFLQILERLKDPATLGHTLRLLEQAGLAPAGEPSAAASRQIPISEPVKGTVTVLVDKGLKIKNRVGVPERMLGSGFFVDPSGYIITNYHVISSEVDPEYEGYSRLYVSRSDRPVERMPAKVVGYDRILDLALLKAEVEAEYVYYPALQTDIRAGDQILAIGSPVSLERTVNSGIVSAVGRRFLQLGDAMQIDVPVNPGNSGGPLVDADRLLIGVVFAGLEQFEGLNFAIPGRWIRLVLPRLFQGGEVTYGWLGASVVETDPGLEVVYAVPGGPAARAGILEGDVLEKVGDAPATTLGDVQALLMPLEPPALVKVQWRRGEERHDALVALAERPFSPIETALAKDTRDRVIFPLFGMKLEKIGQSFGKARYVVRKVLAGSQAEGIGLTADDPLSIEGWKVDEEQKVAVVNMYVKKKSSGYLDGIVQLYAYLEKDTFL